MAKINISLPDALLSDLDALAAELDRSRSGLVAEASARYVAELKAEAEERRRRERALVAAARIDELASRVPAGTDATQLIREDRDAGHRTFDE